MFITFKVILTTLAADFISGFIHWLEDVYAKPGMPLISKIAEDNEIHHNKPREFLKKNWWQSSWDIALASTLIVLAAWYFDVLNWQIVLFAVLLANGNQIHKWSHQNRFEKPAVVTMLQKMYILQSSKQHGKHHSGQKNTHYCVITNFLNPVLERINFWRHLEQFHRFTFSVLRKAF